MGMAAPTFYTAAMVRALPDDGNRYEVVHGELLVTPAPRLSHQTVVTRLVVALERYTEREGVGVVLAAPADISWGSRDVLVQPDVFVVSRREARTERWQAIRTLFLAVEVLSPSSRRADRITKRRLYQEKGVSTYWVVDADRRQVEVWGPGAEFPKIERKSVRWRPVGAERGFSLSLARLFRPI